jgi:hypothetical protein
MKLRSFGCSFVYGSDLSDCPHGVDEHHPLASQLSYPALLSRTHGLEYECYARPAAGNLQIYETLLSNIEPEQDHIYLVNWTWIDRFNHIDETLKTPENDWNPRGWHSILPTDKNKISKVYYQHLHSQFRDKLETLILIKSAIDCLQQMKQQFIMTYSDDLIFETEWHTCPAVILLQKSILPYVKNFDGKSFCSWARDSGFAISDRFHPLDQCHAEASMLLNPAIDAILRRA